MKDRLIRTKSRTRHLHLAGAFMAGALAALGSAPAAAATPDELEAAVQKIDMALYAQCEADVRAWLDARLAKYGDFGVFPDLPHLGHVVIDDNGGAATFGLWRGGICDAGAQLFRAYEMLGDEKYLRAGLKTADALLAVQQPNGHFAGGPHRVNRDGEVRVGGDRNEVRIMLGSLFVKHAYFAKIQFAPVPAVQKVGGKLRYAVPSPAEADQAAADFVKQFLPHILKTLPTAQDVARLDEGGSHGKE